MSFNILFGAIYIACLAVGIWMFQSEIVALALVCIMGSIGFYFMLKKNAADAFAFVCVFLIIWGMSFYQLIESELFFVILATLLAGCITLIPPASIYFKGKAKEERILKEKKEKEEEEKKAREMAEKKERERIFLENEWEFPVEEFYSLCKKENIENLNDDFYLQKAELIANSIINKQNLPQKNREYYISVDKLKGYWQCMEEKEMREQELRRLEIERREKTPVAIKLEQDSMLCKEKIFAIGLENTFGREKRRKYIENERHELSQKIEKNKKRVQELEEEDINNIRTSVKLMSASDGFEKKKDWALLGGIADGIAGPIAGVAVASNAMNQNAEIEARAQQRRESIRSIGMKASERILNARVKLDEEIAQDNRKLDSIEAELDNLETKVVFEKNQRELFEALQIEEVKRKDDEGKFIYSFSIMNTYTPETPKIIKTCIDGLLSIHLKADDIDICTTTMPLPKYGVSCNGGKVTVQVVFDKYIEGRHNFSWNIEPKSLWLMEV